MPRGASSRPFAEEFFAICADLLCVLDGEDRFATANPSLCEFVGREREELTGHRFVDLLDPRERESVGATLRRSRQDRREARLTARVHAREGAFRAVEWRVQTHPDSDALFLMGTDATEKLSAESLHRELSSRHATTLAALPDIVAEVDLNKVYTWVNEAGRDFFGPEVVGREAREFFWDEEPDDVYSQVEPVFEGSEDTLYIETWQRRADGEKRLLGWWCRSMKDEQGRVVGAISTARDITEAKALEESLRDSEHKIKALFDNAAQGIVSVDREGRIVSFNAMAERQFGWARDEILGQPIERLLPSSLEGVHEQHRRSYFLTPHARPMGHGLDLKGRRKDGTEFPVEISLSYIASDQEPAAVAFVNDVTDRRRAEAERERLERHLEHATKMEAVGRLAGGIAHDFNNLLTALSGFSEIALDELPEDHPLYEGARETFKICQRSASLVRRLLAVSRRQVLQPQLMDLNAKIADVEKMLRSVLGEDIDLTVKLEPSLGQVRADESQIEQVVLNLVVNARDAMPTGGKLTIETARVNSDEALTMQTGVSEPGPVVRLSVSDTGCGMDAETLAHIFEPFFTTKEKGKGTGLGLATVYGIVKQSGGHIWAYSEPGRGTSFKVYLPRIDVPGSGPLGHRAGARESAGLRDDPRRRGREHRAARRDERPPQGRLSRPRGPRRRRGPRARRAPTGDRIDLLLTDVVMPKMNGPELAKRVRELLPASRSSTCPATPTTRSSTTASTRPGSRFLEKPFTRESLTRHVREALDSVAAPTYESHVP